MQITRYIREILHYLKNLVSCKLLWIRIFTHKVRIPNKTLHPTPATRDFIGGGSISRARGTGTSAANSPGWREWLSYTFDERSMKPLLSVGLSFILGVALTQATQWAPISLGEQLAGADLVVVGKIVTAEGKITPPPEAREASLAHVWKSKLEITRVLKGNIAEKTLALFWDEIRLSGVPEYQPGEVRIWILKKTKNQKAYSTEGRPDAVLLLDDLSAVEMELKNKTSNKALHSTAIRRAPRGASANSVTHPACAGCAPEQQGLRPLWQ
jgi:hypothetical protein